MNFEYPGTTSITSIAMTIMSRPAVEFGRKFLSRTLSTEKVYPKTLCD
jgi:hypothetical protein